MKMTSIVIHHSAAGISQTVDEIDKYHKSKGWKMIGYHKIIRYDKELQCWVCEDGRPEYMKGSHCKNNNTGRLGICILGNYEELYLSKEARVVLIYELVNLCVEHDINEILGHCEVEGQETACPGKHILEILEGIKEEVFSILPLAYS